MKYYPFTSSQWNAVAVALRDEADAIKALTSTWPRVCANLSHVEQLERDSVDALERAAVAFQREQTSVPEQYSTGGK